MQTASEILPGTRSWETDTSPDSSMRLQRVLSELYRAVKNALQDESESLKNACNAPLQCRRHALSPQVAAMKS
jgi:hypothetical protein